MASAANLRDAAAQLCFASAHSSALSSSSTSHRQCPAAGNCTAGPRLCWKSCLTGNSLQFKAPCASRRRVHCRSTVQADLLAASADAAPILDLAASGFSGVTEVLGALSSGHFASPLTAFFGDLSDDANGLVELQLAALSPASLGVIFSAGIVTSLSPCTLSVLPLTLGYIGASASGKSRHEAILSSIAFCLGLATSLTGMGIAASLTGKALVSGSNQVGGPLSDIASTFGRGLPVAVSIVAVLMGLNLLQVFQLPSLKMGRLNTAELGSSGQGLPSSLQAYIAGLTFALVASPCTTPIRATLLSYVAASQDPVIGGSLLLVYTFGYIVPLLLAASFAGVLQEKVLSVRQISGWANTASGALLLGGGIYTFLMQLQTNPTYSTALADASSTMAVVHHCH